MRRTAVFAIALILVFTPLFSLGLTAFAQEEGAVIYVSPDAASGGDGSIEAPLSLSGAMEKIKTGQPGKTTVCLRGGRYVFDSTLYFDGGGFSGVTFRAYNGEDVVFSGAREIRGFDEDEVNGVKVFTKQLDLSQDGAYFKSLFSEDEKLSVPRYPKTGYFTVRDTAPEDDLWTVDDTPWEFTLGQRSFYADKNDIDLDFTNINDVNVRILHFWHDELMCVTGYDRDSGKISLSRPSSMLIRDIDRYYFENVFEALCEPGEWYLNRETGMLYYVPKEGESADSLVLYGSSLERLIDIEGVDGLSFEGIRFTQTDWNIPEPGEQSGGWRSENDIDALQAALDVKGVITVNRSRDVHFVNCDFTHLGADALKFMNGVKDSSAESCYFEDIAATAVFIGGANCLPDGEDYTSGITVKNCEIYKYGRKFFCAIGIHITYCDTAVIENNEIHDGYYTGVSCGWIWGYSYHATRNISIRRNLIYDIGQGWLSDMGGIYMLGCQPGTVLSENVIHNVAADPGEGGYGGWGIYLDEGSSHMVVENNLVFCCGSQGLNIHYGEGNVFRNNISALNAQGQVSAGSRDEAHATAFYYNNIFVTDKKAPIYIYMQNTSHFYDNGNLMWDISNGDGLVFSRNGGEDVVSLSSAEKSGFVHNVCAEDPLFADINNFDFTLSEESPARELGFTPWDYSLAGTAAGTAVGVSREGGKTAYNEGVAAQEIKASKTGGGFSGTVKAAFAAALALCVFSALGKLFTEAKKRSSLMLLTTLTAAALAFIVYRVFVDWSPVLYVVFSILFCAMLALSSLIPSGAGNKKKAAVKFIIRFAVIYAVFFGVVLLLNNVISWISTPNAILTALFIGFVFLFVNIVRSFKKTD